MNNPTLSSYLYQIDPNVVVGEWQFENTYLSYYDTTLGIDPNNPSNWKHLEYLIIYITTTLDETRIITVNPTPLRNFNFNLNFTAKTLDVSWDPPYFSGNSSISGYRIVAINYNNKQTTEYILINVGSNVTSINNYSLMNLKVTGQ